MEAAKSTKISPPYQRVLLKVSGEALTGSDGYRINPAALKRIALDVAEVHRAGVEVCLVIGGGNVFRGVSGAVEGFDRTGADHMGMLATVINALAVQNALEQLDIPTRVQSAISMERICESYIRRRAARHMEKGRVVIFAAGTGNPFFTTDTAATLRAVEMGCDAILKGTQVDGVYSDDPHKVPDAVRYTHLTYLDVISQDLAVMDTSAISLARDNRIPIVVFSIHEPGGFAQAVQGKGDFTIIDDGEGKRRWRREKRLNPWPSPTWMT